MTKDSTATLSPVETLAMIEKRLKSVIRGEIAPRPDGKNALIVIDIDVNALTATFHCQEYEKTGAQENRHITFQADGDCTLHFLNTAVFGIDHQMLQKGVPKPLFVAKGVGNAQTEYYATITVASTSEDKRVEPRNVTDPKIVVP